AYRRGEPCDESYGLELFHRATVRDDAEAWGWVQHCFGDIVLAWLRRHSSRATACRLESEATCIALAFRALLAGDHRHAAGRFQDVGGRLALLASQPARSHPGYAA